MSNIAIHSKLPDLGTTIFTVMSSLANRHGAINLSQGFPNYSSPRALIDLVTEHMVAGHNQYAPMPGLPLLRERIADKAAALYGLRPDPETEVTVTAGAAQAIFTAIAAFIHAGDEVIVIEPAYDLYVPAIRLNGAIPVAYELRAPYYRIDWDELRSLLTPRTRMLIINTPHNPSGTCLGREDLAALETILDGTDVLVLSDEVYEHLVFDGRDHQSVLRFPALWERSIVTYSFGKTFHNTGWKIGYALAPEILMAEFRKVHQYNVFSVNTPMQHALADYLADPAVYRELPVFYQGKRDFFLETMAGSSLRPLTCEGTYFHLFDYSAVSDLTDTEFCRWLTTEIGVAAIPVSVFYQSGRDDSVVRFCFAKTEDVLEQAGAILRRL